MIGQCDKLRSDQDFELAVDRHRSFGRHMAIVAGVTTSGHHAFKGQHTFASTSIYRHINYYNISIMTISV